MKCTTCGAEVGGKRFCPNCNAENTYEGAVPANFPKKNPLKSVFKFVIKPATLFSIFCLAVIMYVQLSSAQ